MNQINWFENNIASVEALLIADQKKLEESPDSFAAKVMLKSKENHLNSLRHSLRKEKEKRDIEVLELHFKGAKTNSGDIPLELFAKLSDHLAKALYSAGYKIKTGREYKNKVSKNVKYLMDIRFSNISYGSTKLFITGKLNPDINGRSITEETFKNIFKVIQSNHDDNELANAFTSLGSRSAKNLASFFKVLAENKIHTKLNWSSTIGESKAFSSTPEQLTSLVETLNELNEIPSADVCIRGTVIAAKITGSLSIRVSEKFPPITIKTSSDFLISPKDNYMGKEVKIKAKAQSFYAKDGSIQTIYTLIDFIE